MTALALLAVVIGAAVGAPARFVVDHVITSRTTRWIDSPRTWARLPWGLLAVNIFGSLLLGIVLSSVTGSTRYLLASGLCGTLTTFSSYGWHAHRSWRTDRPVFWLGMVVMTLGCIAAFGIAFSIGVTAFG